REPRNPNRQPHRQPQRRADSRGHWRSRAIRGTLDDVGRRGPLPQPSTSRRRRSVIARAVVLALVGVWGPPGPLLAASPAAAPSPVAAAAQPDPSLPELIDAALSDPALAEATVGISAVDLHTGRVLYE